MTTIQPGTIFATLLGLVAAGIVWSSLAGSPVFGSDRAALVALVVTGFAMCIASGVGNAAGTVPPGGVVSAIAGLAGLLSVLVLIAVAAGWTVILDPISGVIYGTSSQGIADRMGVLLVGVLIAIAWLMATLRQTGLIGTAAS